MIAAILTYKHCGIRSACGQTVGADGAGDYAVVFIADNPDLALEDARQYASWLTKPYIKELKIITAHDTYHGCPILVRQV